MSGEEGGRGRTITVAMFAWGWWWGGWGGGLAEKNLILYPEKGKDNFKTVFRIRILADAGFSNDPDPGFI